MFLKHYARLYEQFNQKKNYKKEIEFVYRWAKEPPSIFDIGCGTAHYWKYYPLGVQLRGMEKSNWMIEESAHRSQIFLGDIRESKLKNKIQYDCVTAIFDVINYIPEHKWWKNLPLTQGGYFIFDVLDLEKVNKEGFKQTIREIDGIKRTITPVFFDGKQVELSILIEGETRFTETHKMYLFSHEDIIKFAGDEFTVETKPTKFWQKWYRLQKK